MQSKAILRARTSKRRNVLALFCLSTLLNGATDDVRVITQRSLDSGDRNAVRVHEYYSTKHVDTKQFASDGSVHSETMKTYDYVLIGKLLIRKLMTKDGKPLPPSDARKEDERVNRIATSRQHETPAEKTARLVEEEKKTVKQHEFSKEIFSAFNFRLIGEEQIAGRKNWVIEATPRPGYKPKELRAQIFPHVDAKVWIDQQDYLWTKAEATASSPISFGFGIIAKLEQGAHFYFNQIRTSDGVWLLRDSGIRAVAHVAIVKRIGVEEVSTLDNFRKVPSGVVVVDDSPGN